MKLEMLITWVGDQPCFDLATLVQLSNERRESIRTQLYRWARDGKVCPLRRGMYTLAEPFRKVPVNTAELANRLYAPSYLSTFWALSYYGLIPEMTVVLTSVTRRVPRLFENAFGRFQYTHIKSEGFFGYRPMEILGREVLMAEPEKALLDLWYLGKGEWVQPRIVEMRFQNTDALNLKKLEDYAQRFESPRLQRALEGFMKFAAAEQDGEVEL
ncbi:MAG: hypothetical protein JW937_02180 [Candidatus Omnitrophica bacterium]|nr:hypothetical protein [Candidatus Omnitrophota bacterium]